MNLKEGDLLYDGTNVFRVTAYVAEPQVTIAPVGTSGDATTYPLSQLPKGMVKLVPETERSKKRKTGKAQRRPVRTKRSNLSPSGKLSFRANSKMKRAYAFLEEHGGKPLTVTQILQGIGEPITNSSRATIASDLYRTVKKGGEIKLISPGLFAFQELVTKEKTQAETKNTFHLPSDFGKE